jgi:hypothetical protein
MVIRIIFRHSQCLWAFNHSRKIQAVAVATDIRKPYLATYGLSGQKEWCDRQLAKESPV